MIPSKRKLSTMRPEYFPTLEYFWYLSQCDLVVITDHFPYSKKTALSISAPINNTNIDLRLPVIHDREINPIYKKTISNKSDWPREHLSTLRHQYHKQPFEYLYFPTLKQLLNSKESSLSQFFADQILQIAKWLHIETQIYRASDIGFQIDNNHTVFEWCNKFKCEIYINSPYIFEQNFVNKEKLQNLNITICEFKKLPDANIFQYYKDKSILSFLFQFGPETGYLIQEFMHDS